MATNAKNKSKKRIQGKSGGGGQQSAGTRLRAKPPKAAGKNPKTGTGGRVGRKGGARVKASS